MPAARVPHTTEEMTRGDPADDAGWPAPPDVLVLAEARTGYATNGATPSAFVAPWSQARNDLFDEAMKVLSGPGFKCAMHIARQTAGFHRASVHLTLQDFADETGVSRRQIVEALAEIEGAGIVTITTTGKGRGMVAIYTLRPNAEWHLPNTRNGLPIKPPRNGAKSAPINGAKSAPIPTGNGAKSAPIRPKNGAKSAPPINKGEKETGEKETPASLDAAGRATPPNGPKLAAAEREYRAQLLEAVRPLRGQAIVNHGQEWAAAGRFYRAPGGPAPIATVVALWEVECRRPKWEGGPQLTLAFLATCYAAFVKSPDGYRANVERSRKGARGDYDAPKAHGARASPPPQAAYTADQINPFKRREQSTTPTTTRGE